MPRFHCATPLRTGDTLELPASAARHVQVLRLQPGDGITLFNGGADLPADSSGNGGEFDATVVQMGRNTVTVHIGQHHGVAREAARGVHLGVGMPANERMDWLIEKATELGVASIWPLQTERCVLRLKGERAEKKLAHWRSVAIAACEQCGRNRVPVVHDAIDLAGWVRAQTALAAQAPTQGLGLRLLLSLREGTAPLRTATAAQGPVLFLSGPEGGLSSAEEDIALQHGFAPVTLGPRVLRAETAPLAALAALTL